MKKSEDKKKMLEGLPVSRGTITGTVRVMKDHRMAALVNEGDILVVPRSHPNYAVGVMKAGGLICEEGGRLSHLCIVAMEMGIPCITQAKGAVALLETACTVTLDASEGTVYEA